MSTNRTDLENVSNVLKRDPAGDYHTLTTLMTAGEIAGVMSKADLLLALHELVRREIANPPSGTFHTLRTLRESEQMRRLDPGLVTLVTEELVEGEEVIVVPGGFIRVASGGSGDPVDVPPTGDRRGEP